MEGTPFACVQPSILKSTARKLLLPRGQSFRARAIHDMCDSKRRKKYMLKLLVCQNTCEQGKSHKKLHKHPSVMT
jgi:hypothetical protein